MSALSVAVLGATMAVSSFGDSLNTIPLFGGWKHIVDQADLLRMGGGAPQLVECSGAPAPGVRVPAGMQLDGGNAEHLREINRFDGRVDEETDAHP